MDQDRPWIPGLIINTGLLPQLVNRVVMMPINGTVQPTVRIMAGAIVKLSMQAVQECGAVPRPEILLLEFITMKLFSLYIMLTDQPDLLIEKLEQDTASDLIYKQNSYLNRTGLRNVSVIY